MQMKENWVMRMFSEEESVFIMILNLMDAHNAFWLH